MSNGHTAFGDRSPYFRENDLRDLRHNLPYEEEPADFRLTNPTRPEAEAIDPTNLDTAIFGEPLPTPDPNFTPESVNSASFDPENRQNPNPITNRIDSKSNKLGKGILYAYHEGLLSRNFRRPTPESDAIQTEFSSEPPITNSKPSPHNNQTPNSPTDLEPDISQIAIKNDKLSPYGKRVVENNNRRFEMGLIDPDTFYNNIRKGIVIPVLGSLGRQTNHLEVAKSAKSKSPQNPNPSKPSSILQRHLNSTKTPKPPKEPIR